MTTVRGYAEVVYATADVLLSRLSASDRRSSVDLSDGGLGHADVGWVLNRFVLRETAMICSELAATSVAWSRGAISPRAERVHAFGSRNGRANGRMPRSPWNFRQSGTDCYALSRVDSSA
jgi:hypothetical protein